MRPTTIGLFCLAVTVGCGGSSAPTTPTNATPAPTTATPAPAATPNPFVAACGSPLPNLGDLYGFGIKVQLEPSKRKKILNANPYVRNAAYCASPNVVPYPNPLFCETRQEQNPERVPCDSYITGMSDEGEIGPIWYQEVNGKRLRCPGKKLPGDAPGCELKENSFLLDVYMPGKYIACGGTGSNGTCGVCILDADEYETPDDVIQSGTRRPGLCQVD